MKGNQLPGTTGQTRANRLVWLEHLGTQDLRLWLGARLCEQGGGFGEL